MPILTFLNRIFRSSLHFLLVLVFLIGIIGVSGELNIKVEASDYATYLVEGCKIDYNSPTGPTQGCKVGNVKYSNCLFVVKPDGDNHVCKNKQSDQGAGTQAKKATAYIKLPDGSTLNPTTGIYSTKDGGYATCGGTAGIYCTRVSDSSKNSILQLGESNGYNCIMSRKSGNSESGELNDCTSDKTPDQIVTRAPDICSSIYQSGELKMNCKPFAIVFKQGSKPDSIVSWDYGGFAGCYAVKTTSGENKCISNAEIQNACKGALISTSIQRTLNGWIANEATCDTVTYDEFIKNLGPKFTDISAVGIGGATQANVVTAFDPTKCIDLTEAEKIEAQKLEKFKTLAEGETLQKCAGQILKKLKDGSFEAKDGTQYNTSGNVTTKLGNGDKAGNPVGAVFGMLYKIVLMIILIIMIVVEMIQMLVLLLMTNITAILFNLSPNAPFLTVIAVPLSITFANLANLLMGFLFIFTGSQAMMGIIKVKQAIDRCIQLAIYVIVSNFVYQCLAFVISVVDGFAQLVIKVFAGGDIIKLFYGLFSQFASISDLRDSGSIFPSFEKSGAAIGGAFSQPEGLYTALVMKEAIIIIMFFVMLWIFKDTFVLVLTRSTILLLFLITSPLLALAYLVKDLLPGSLQKQVGDLPNQIFTAISFNLSFVIALVLCFRITQVSQESFKAALKTNTLLGGTAPATPGTPAAFLDAIGGNITGSAQAANGFSQAASGLMVSVISIAPVFMGLCILYFINEFYNKEYFPKVKEAMSSVGKGVSGTMQDFMKAKNFREGLGNMASGVLGAGIGAATGQRGNETNLIKDGIGAGMKSTAIGLKVASKLPETVVKAPGRLVDGTGKVIGNGGELVGKGRSALAMKLPGNKARQASLSSAQATADGNLRDVTSNARIAKDQAVAYAKSQGFADDNGNVNETLMPRHVRAQYDAFVANQSTKEALIAPAQSAKTTAESDLVAFKNRTSGGVSAGLKSIGGGVSSVGQGLTNNTVTGAVTAIQDNSVVLPLAGALGDAKFMNSPQKNQSRIINAVSGDDGKDQKDNLKDLVKRKKDRLAKLERGELTASDLEIENLRDSIIDTEAAIKGIK
jgi:hypothetical protein